MRPHSLKQSIQHKNFIRSAKERKANLGQTLTGLGSYWKGRKPLILVRSVVLGTLLPQTEDTEKDLEIFEMLMGFDIESLAKRALIQNDIKPAEIAARIQLHNPWDYFSHNVKVTDDSFNEIDTLQFPINSDALGLKLRWRRDIEENEKLALYRDYLETIEGYEAKASLCKRPEEVDQSGSMDTFGPPSIGIIKASTLRLNHIKN